MAGVEPAVCMDALTKARVQPMVDRSMPGRCCPGVRGRDQVRLLITYDPEAGCAYVQVGAFRYSDRQVELDDDTIADYDERGDIIGIEFIGVSEPELAFASRVPKTVNVPVKGDLL